MKLDPTNPEDQWVPKPRVAKRYHSCAKTIDRWEDDPKLGFPKSIAINRRRYWRLSELQDWERARAAASHREAA